MPSRIAKNVFIGHVVVLKGPDSSSEQWRVVERDYQGGRVSLTLETEGSAKPQRKQIELYAYDEVELVRHETG